MAIGLRNGAAVEPASIAVRPAKVRYFRGAKGDSISAAILNRIAQFGLERQRTGTLGSVLTLVCLIACAGCTRERYFRQADQEVDRLIAEKSCDPRWAAPPDFTVAMDPRSRFYDADNILHPPMPEDDPAAHEYMHCVDGKKAYRRWHADGERMGLENPGWRENLDSYSSVEEDGTVGLTLETAVEMARINAPDYQDQLETLYLSALDVSTERFRFDVQFFGGNSTRVTRSGHLSDSGEVTTVETDSNFRAQRRLATAGELLVGFANSFVWTFAGTNTNADVSILNFNLVQPLLRNAGRAVALEQLTISERALLGNLRAFERYRQGFFTKVAIGELGVTGPQRRGGFFGGTGLTGFTGTGSGGIGGVASIGSSGAGGGVGQIGGYIGLLQQAQQIRLNKESLSLRTRLLRLFEAHLEANTIDQTQVDQFRQSILSGRAVLLQSQNALQDALDNYKIGTLGMPPDLTLKLDENLVRQFNFVDPAMTALQNRLSDFNTEFGEQPAEPPLATLQQTLDRLAKLRLEAEQQADEVGSDCQNALSKAPERQASMQPDEAQTLSDELQKLLASYHDLRKQLTACGPKLNEVRAAATADKRRETAEQIVMLVNRISSAVDELSLVQVRARMEAVSLQHEKLSEAHAMALARANRLDWMNNRAALVDTWRLITYNAKALESNLSTTFSGDVSTVGDNPLKFRTPTGNLKVGLQFDAPFTRLLERNNFRQVLIDYQRDRRRLIQFEDSVQRSLRAQLRDLQQLQLNLEIQRSALALAIRRVDQTREVLRQPPPLPAPGQPTVPLGATATLNLLSALNDLYSTQNSFMSIWLNYFGARMRLQRELGVMQLDERGLWVDQPLAQAELAAGAEVVLPPAVPEAWLRELEAQPGEKPPVQVELRDGPAPGAAAPLPAPRPAPAPVNPKPANPKPAAG